jgi:hypothetical protein
MAKRKRATAAFKEKIQRDVETVRTRAIATINLSNGTAEVFWSQNPSLAIIAIIGPGSAFNYQFPEAVLDEVGIGWGRPFYQARVPFFLQKEGESPNITYRASGFKLSAKQYQIAAPAVFKILQELTDQRVGARACRPSSPYYVFSHRAAYRRKGRKLTEWVKQIPVLSGCRFAVSVDSIFATDVYWAELNKNMSLRNFLEGLAKFTDLCLRDTLREWRGKKNFWDLKISSKIKGILERKNLPFYLLVELLGYLPGGSKNRFWQDIGNIFGWDGEQTRERELSHSVLPESDLRVGDIQLRIVTGLERKLDHIVFEIFPSEEWKKYKVQKSFDEPEYEGKFEPDFDPAHDLPF